MVSNVENKWKLISYETRLMLKKCYFFVNAKYFLTNVLLGSRPIIVYILHSTHII